MDPRAKQELLYERTRKVATVPTFTNAGKPARATLSVTLRISRETLPDWEMPWQTVEHGETRDRISVSLNGDRQRGRVWEGGGQNVEDLTEEGRAGIDPYDRADLDRLAVLWERWHMNDARAGCVHQPRITAEQALRDGFVDRYGRGDTFAAQRAKGPCPESGYPYGRAWLVEPVPTSALVDLLGLFEKLPAKGDAPARGAWADAARGEAVRVLAYTSSARIVDGVAERGGSQ